MLGYMTAKNAKAQGFTHHGSYFGIPIWIGDVESIAPLVAPKWAPMELGMTVAHHIEQILASIFWMGQEPVFRFWVGEPIGEIK